MTTKSFSTNTETFTGFTAQEKHLAKRGNKMEKLISTILMCTMLTGFLPACTKNDGGNIYAIIVESTKVTLTKEQDKDLRSLVRDLFKSLSELGDKEKSFRAFCLDLMSSKEDETTQKQKCAKRLVELVDCCSTFKVGTISLKNFCKKHLKAVPEVVNLLCELGILAGKKYMLLYDSMVLEKDVERQTKINESRILQVNDKMEKYF